MASERVRMGTAALTLATAVALAAGCSGGVAPREAEPPEAPRTVAATAAPVAATQGPATDEPEQAIESAEAAYTGASASGLSSTVHDSAGRSYEMVTILPKDGIPAVFEPSFISAKEADARASGLADALRQLSAASADPDQDAVALVDSELVIGVSIGGDHRAYSVPYLSRHEIVNDVVGGRPIVVTW